MTEDRHTDRTQKRIGHSDLPVEEIPDVAQQFHCAKRLPENSQDAVPEKFIVKV